MSYETLELKEEGPVAWLRLNRPDSLNAMNPQLVTEVRSRLNQLYNRIGGWPGRPTGDQVSQISYLQEWIGRLVPRVEAVLQ